MSANKKTTSPQVASLAARTLANDQSSGIARRLAGSVLSQTGTSRQTGADLETRASRVLQSPKYSDETKTLAASVLAQSNKER